MWHTSIGDRYLVGAEAELVRNSLAVLADQVADLLETERDTPSDGAARWATPLDPLPGTQQLALLYDVAHHLLNDTPVALPLTAVSESAIAAIFTQIRTGVELEIDDQLDPCDRNEHFSGEDLPDLPSWRELILAAHQETLAEDEREEWLARGDDCPTALDTDMDQWENLLETLMDRILWDRDYELEGHLVDADPEQAARTKLLLGIEDDHFSEPAPDVRDRDTRRLMAKIRAITHAKR
jgi:hypothetical protein